MGNRRMRVTSQKRRAPSSTRSRVTSGHNGHEFRPYHWKPGSQTEPRRVELWELPLLTEEESYEQSLFTIKELAFLLGISPSAVNSRIHTRHLQPKARRKTGSANVGLYDPEPIEPKRYPLEA